MTKKHEHELVNNQNGKVIGHVWWNPDKGEVETSNANSKEQLMYTSASDVHSEHFVKDLSRYFRNGYISARRVK